MGAREATLGRMGALFSDYAAPFSWGNVNSTTRWLIGVRMPERSTYISLNEPERTVTINDGRPIRLRPKSFALLSVLARNARDTVSKDLLIDSVWKTTVATDESLAQCVCDVRRALADRDHRLIQNFSGAGYRLNAELAGSECRGGERRSRAQVGIVSFQPLSDNGEIRHFAEGLTASIIAELTQSDLLEVLSPILVKAEDAGKAGFAEFGADYEISGTVQGRLNGGDGILRVSASLSSCTDKRVLWSKRWSEGVSDYFSIEDEIAVCVVNELAGLWSGRFSDFAANARRHVPTRDLDAFHAFHRGVILTRNFDAASLSAAIECMETAVATDPSYSEAWAALSILYGLATVSLSGADLSHMVGRRLEASKRAFARHPRSSWALLAGAWSRAHDGDADAARFLIREAVARAPTDADVLIGAAGIAALNTELYEEAEDWTGRALALNSVAPDWYHFPVGFARFFRGLPEDALRALERSPQEYAEVLVFRAACEGELGYADQARISVDRLMAIAPGFSSAAYLMSEPFGPPVKRHRLAAALSKAGLPP